MNAPWFNDYDIIMIEHVFNMMFITFYITVVFMLLGISTASRFWGPHRSGWLPALCPGGPRGPKQLRLRRWALRWSGRQCGGLRVSAGERRRHGGLGAAKLGEPQFLGGKLYFSNSLSLVMFCVQCWSGWVAERIAIAIECLWLTAPIFIQIHFFR